MLTRALDLPAGKTRFVDVPYGHPLREAVTSLAQAGITSGCGPGVFCVDEPVTRQQVASLLRRALG